MSDSDDRQYVDYECHDHIATITLNRPEKLNAVSDEVVRQLMAAFRRFDTDAEAHVAILCGRGRAFCSGADVHQRQLRSREEFERLGGPQGQGANSGDLLFQSVNWKPVIAAVHGYVLGLGLGMVLDCDLIVAEAGTRFQLTETSRGLGAAKHWAQFHFRGAGAFGDEVSLTGRYFTAEEALAANVINRVAPKDQFLEVAMSLARVCCGKSTLVSPGNSASAALVPGSLCEGSGLSAGADATVFNRRLSRSRTGVQGEAQAAPVQGAIKRQQPVSVIAA